MCHTCHKAESDFTFIPLLQEEETHIYLGIELCCVLGRKRNI